MKSHWRTTSRQIIAQVLKDNEGADEKVIRKALTDAYPFGQRAMHPYKIWLSEIQIQLGKRRFGEQKRKFNPDQKELFK
jgi:hypothetical protein